MAGNNKQIIKQFIFVMPLRCNIYLECLFIAIHRMKIKIKGPVPHIFPLPNPFYMTFEAQIINQSAYLFCQA